MGECVNAVLFSVIDNASITSTFRSYIQQLSYNYRVQTVNTLKIVLNRIARLVFSLLHHLSSNKT